MNSDSNQSYLITEVHGDEMDQYSKTNQMYQCLKFILLE